MPTSLTTRDQVASSFFTNDANSSARGSESAPSRYAFLNLGYATAWRRWCSRLLEAAGFGGPWSRSSQCFVPGTLLAALALGNARCVALG